MSVKLNDSFPTFTVKNLHLILYNWHTFLKLFFFDLLTRKKAQRGGLESNLINDTYLKWVFSSSPFPLTLTSKHSAGIMSNFSEPFVEIIYKLARLTREGDSRLSSSGVA